MPTYQDEQDQLLAEEQQAADQEAQPPGPYQGGNYQADPVTEIHPYTAPIPQRMAAPPQEADVPYAELPRQTAEPPIAYQGQAFPGLPVIQEGGQNYYNGERMPSEQAAFEARARHAAASPEQQATIAERGRQQEATSIELQQEISRLQPSPADMQELNQMQNGLVRLRRDAAQGLISPQMADQLERQLQQKMAPRMVSLSQIRGMRAALEVAHLRETVMHQTMARVNSNTYFAANAPGTTPSVTDASGREIARMFIGPDGHAQQIAVREPVDRSAQTEQARARAQELSLHHYNQALSHNVDLLTRQAADVTAPEAIRNQTPDQIFEAAAARTQRTHAASMRAVGLNPDGTPYTPPAPGSAGAAPTSAAAPAGGQATQGATQAPRRTEQRPMVEEANTPSDLPPARLETLGAILSASAPSLGNRRGDVRGAIVPARDPLNESFPNDERGLVSRMYGLVENARRDNRTLTQGELFEYGRAQRRLAQDNPDLASQFSVAPTPVQQAFESPRTDLLPALRTEATRLEGTSRGWRAWFGGSGPNTEDRRAVISMQGILGTAIDAHRPLTHAETTRYLDHWRVLRRYNPEWADRMQLHREQPQARR